MIVNICHTCTLVIGGNLCQFNYHNLKRIAGFPTMGEAIPHAFIKIVIILIFVEAGTLLSFEL